ncbi:MAG TPA: CrcB family protein [Thermoanaerobaculia bacterium]|nr:CrcB family protein [Thermoanaerobaculia bacterium]
MTRLLLVCTGGAIGSGARYLTALWAARAFGPAFPFGTLIVNVLGSFLITLIIESARFTPDVRLFLTTGVLGGFTTYSAFNHDATEYLHSGAYTTAFTYIAATLLGCLTAGFAAVAVARSWS